LTVTFVETSSSEPPKVAYAIGSRVGGAVVRNRLRRRLRAIVRETAPQLRPGAYLITAAPAAAHLTFGEMRTTVREMLGATAETGGTGDNPTRPPGPGDPA
jgi:ribonuclease P protein component